MPAASLNLQRGIHVTPKLRHETFKGKRVELCGELLSLRQKLPSLGKKLPCFAVNKSDRLELKSHRNALQLILTRRYRARFCEYCAFVQFTGHDFRAKTNFFGHTLLSEDIRQVSPTAMPQF